MMSKRRPAPPSARALRRQGARADARLADDRARLAALEPGGAPDRPIDVESASVIEVRAASMPCTRCGSDVRVDAHDAVTHDGRLLRAVRTGCKQCGQRRALWFHVAERALN